MIATTLGAIISIGVISSLTYLGRNLVRTSNITSLMSAASIASATLQRDVAMASRVTALGTTHLSLSVKQGGWPETVAYNWNAATGEHSLNHPRRSVTFSDKLGADDRHQHFEPAGRHFERTTDSRRIDGNQPHPAPRSS